PTPAPISPPAGCGARRAERRRRPWLTVLVGALVMVASTGIGYRLYKQYGDPEHAAQILADSQHTRAHRLYKQYGDPEHAPRILSESERTADHVTIRFEVRSDGRNPAVCIVQAKAQDGLVIGSAEVPVPAG